ncbi:hypothetical protein AAG570_010485 [Ranatra chinensis]|uniref:LisH domain-containing protein n=1 Tax=Ranatra chinensis TaxID=642074 RepID=A0ABD0YMN6_9HEMI
MEAFLPTEIARLVYGYLKEEECDQAAQIFLETSKHLVECLMVTRKGRRFHTRVLGRNLVEILDLFSEVVCLVRSEVKNIGCNDGGNDFLKSLIRILGIDECKTAVSNKTNTVYLSISVPAQEDNVKRKAPVTRVVETSQSEESAKQSKKHNSPNSKSQPEKTNEEEDALFDLNMLNTLLDNNVLHQRLADNINKAILTGEKVKQKGEDNKIIETILHNTEADPIFEEIVCDLAAPRAEESSTPEDTEVEGGETGDEIKSDQQSKENNNEAKCVDTVTEQHVEQQNDEAVRGILASGYSCPQPQPQAEVAEGITDAPSLEVPTTPVPPKSLVEIAMEKAGVSEKSTIQLSPSPPPAPVSFLTTGGSVPDNMTITSQAEHLMGLPPPVQTTMLQPMPQANSPQLCTQYNLLQVLPSNLTTLYIQPGGVSGGSGGGMAATPSTFQQFSPAPQPVMPHPSSQNIYTIDNIPPVPPQIMRRIKPKPPCRAKPASSSTDPVKPHEEPQSVPEAAPVIKRSGVRTRGGFQKMRGRQKGPMVRALVPKIKSIKNDQVDVELTECFIEKNVKRAPKVSPTVTKRSLRSRENTRGGRISPDGNSTQSSRPSADTGKEETLSKEADSSSDKKPPEESPQREQVPDKVRPSEQLLKESTTSSKVPDDKNTPKQVRVISAQKRKRLSLSTPRRGSHVRTLDFRTPIKKGAGHVRRANTSPKKVSQSKLAQFQKSIRKVCRGSLFNSPNQGEQSKAKPWDADLRFNIGETTDIPSSVGLKRKSEEEPVSKVEKSKEDSPPEKTPEKPNNSGSNLGLDPEVSIDRLATSDEIVKHIRKEVLDVIGEEDLTLTLSPDKFKQHEKSVHDKSDEMPTVILVDENPHTHESSPSPEKQIKKPTPAKDTNEATSEFTKDTQSMPSLAKTPAKLDFAGVLPKSQVPMTPLSRIISEQTNILDGKKLLTPGFPPTPQNTGPPEKVSPQALTTPSPPPQALIKTPPEPARVKPAAENTVQEPKSEQSKSEIKTAKEPAKKSPSNLNKSKKVPKENKSLSPKNLKNNSTLKKSLGNKGSISRAKKTNTKGTKKDNYFEDEHFIIQCLQSAKEELFGASDSSSSSDLSSFCVPVKPKVKPKPKVEEKVPKRTDNNKKMPVAVQSNIQPPSFDVAMERLKSMSHLSDGSSSDDSVLVENARIRQKKILGKGIMNEEEASHDSFPRLHLSDDEINQDDVTKSHKMPVSLNAKKSVDSESKENVNKTVPEITKPNNSPKHKKNENIDAHSSSDVVPETRMKISHGAKEAEPKPPAKKYGFLESYTETYTVISSETGEAVNRVFKVSPVISLFEHGLKSKGTPARGEDRAADREEESTPQRAVQPSPPKRMSSVDVRRMRVQKSPGHTPRYSPDMGQAQPLRDELNEENFRHGERRTRYPQRGRHPWNHGRYHSGRYPRREYYRGRSRERVWEDRYGEFREKSMRDRSRHRSRDYRDRNSEEERSFGKETKKREKDKVGLDRSSEREKLYRSEEQERKMAEKSRSCRNKDRDKSPKTGKSSNKATEKDVRCTEWNRSGEGITPENVREREGNEINGKDYRELVPSEKEGERGGGEKDERTVRVRAASEKEREKESFYERGERTEKGYRERERAPLEKDRERSYMERVRSEKGYRDRELLEMEGGWEGNDRGGKGPKEWRRGQPLARNSIDPIAGRFKNSQEQSRGVEEMYESDQSFFVRPVFTSSPLPQASTSCKTQKMSVTKIMSDGLSGGLKRKFVDEKEEGELSDCSSIHDTVR